MFLLVRSKQKLCGYPRKNPNTFDQFVLTPKIRPSSGGACEEPRGDVFETWGYHGIMWRYNEIRWLKIVNKEKPVLKHPKCGSTIQTQI